MNASSTYNGDTNDLLYPQMELIFNDMHYYPV